MSRPFWLVQRLTRLDRARKGFDGMFACQYMGSAEFEFGAIPESLARIRKASGRGISVIEVEGRRLYVYGGRTERTEALKALPDWIGASCPGKEHSSLIQHMHGQPTWTEVDAWWALREDVIFTLTRGMADDVAKAVSAR